MKSNFDFINVPRFAAIYEAAKEAETNVYTQSVTSGMLSRQAMELLLNWVYDIDDEYELPHPNNLAGKIYGDMHQDVSSSMVYELNFIRKVGNNATHSRKITTREALICINYLFHFSQYVVQTYVGLAFPLTFDENLLPKEDSTALTQRALELMRKKLAEEIQKAEQLRLKNERQAQENEKIKAELKAVKAKAATTKQANQHIPIPDIASKYSEAKTRLEFIDVELKAAGWDLDAPNVKEYKIHNMPKHINQTGTGYVDYVLWGDDGLPLAIIEAKRTSKSVKSGKAQAEVYADCLEKIFNRRPIIFYTNGLEIQLWDDVSYPPRPVYGYYKKEELQLMIDRRTTRHDLRKYLPNPAIAGGGRPYQIEAIKRVSENFVAERANGTIKGNRRKSLLVMATGTGKTRTAIALVEILMKANWAKRVLFLADRTALVQQALDGFKEHLPQLSAINLSKGEEDDTARLVFSTYPTILNRIDSTRNADGTLFGVGHFDLVIVDEAHRSIYKKYEDIFHYFDGLIVGLTATPRDETHRDTYEFFDCPNKNPTYYYELDQAVKDKFLVPPLEFKIETKFLKRGIKYDELSDEDKEQYEAAFAAWGEEIKEEISASDINKWLFNKDTVIKVLEALMTNGYHVDSGDTIGKTIVFAKNQKHAEFIETVFNQQYPQFSGHFAKTISYKDGKFAQDRIDKFKDKDQFPQIAISVDMLETGIDVPEILNLVFFKPVYSKTKFWQMLGRGTRLCKNLDVAGHGQDKANFLVFDCFDNFDFFKVRPEGRTSNVVKSLSHRIFDLRIQLAEALRVTEYQSDDALQTYRTELLDASHALVKELFDDRENQFRVKMRLTIIQKYSKRSAWNNLAQQEITEIAEKIGPLVHIEDKDIKAKQFDALLYKMQLAHCQSDPIFAQGQNNIQKRAEQLATMSNVPAVRSKLPTIRAIQDDNYWNNISLVNLQTIQTDLRDLMKLIISNSRVTYQTNIEDIMTVGEAQSVYLPTAPADYLARVKSFIRQQKNHIVIRKIHNNQQITTAELEQLEHLLFDGDKRGTKADFQAATGTDAPLGQFIRSIIGLDRSAALAAFSTFLQQGNLSAQQQKFIEHIINFFEVNGFLDPAMLYEPPFTNIHSDGLDGVFGDTLSDNIVRIVQDVNILRVG